MDLPLRSSLAPILCAAIGLAPALAADCQSTNPALTFEKIADTNTAVPGGTGTFALFADARALENGKVAFVAHDSGSGSGIYTFQGGVLAMLVDEQTTVPGTGSTFTSFFDVALDGSLVAFTGGWPGPGGGCSFSGSEGVFGMRYSGGNVVTVASSLTTPNNCFHGLDFEHRVIGVAGGVDPVDGIHNHSEAILATGQIGSLTKVFDTTTTSPSGGTFIGYDQDFCIRQGGILFTEILPNTIGAVAGIYKDLRDGQGVQLVADRNTAVPNGTGAFMNFAGVDWDGQTVAFMGRDANNYGVLYKGSSPANLQVAVDRTDAVPGEGVNFLGFSNPLAYEGGVLAFSGYWSGGGIGLFTEAAGTITPILKKGDVLDGSVVEQAYCRSQNKSGNQMLVDVRFQGSLRALYLVTL